MSLVYEGHGAGVGFLDSLWHRAQLVREVTNMFAEHFSTVFKLAGRYADLLVG